VLTAVFMENLMGRYRNVSFLLAAVLLQALGLAIQIRRSADGQSSETSSRLIRVWAVSAVTPLEKVIVRMQSGAGEVWHNYFYLRGVRQENRGLREQIEQLKLDQERLKQDADQAHRLQALLGFKEQFIAKTTAAQVIGSSGSEQSRVVYLDKGAKDGIANGMAVISADGVVGKVIAVYKGTSQVLLINDQQSGVGTILEQSRLQGVVKGTASGALVIDKIMTDEDVKPGDRVLTSGGDQIFPKGLPVGTVSRATKGTEFLQIAVKPAAELSHLEEVLVIMKKEEHETTDSAATTVRAADILAQRLPAVPDKPAVPPTKTSVVAAVPKNATPNSAAQNSASENAGTANSVAPNTGGVQPKPQPARSNATNAASAANPKAATTSVPSSKPAVKPATPAVSNPDTGTVTGTSPAQPPPDNPGNPPQ
jgi:rod shape-determining protein MreC